VAQFDDARQAKSFSKATLLSLPNVVGIGIGYKVSERRRTDEISVVVLVRQKIPLAGLAKTALIPQEVNGVRTDVMQVGDIRPLQARTSRWRPVPAGVSLGHYKITAGTFGCMVYDRTDGKPLMLSNNHVLANSNDASSGDAILQPGSADGGQVDRDTIGYLERFCPIRFNTSPPACNLAKGYADVGNAIARLAGSKHRLQALQVHPMASNLIDAAVARPMNLGVLQDMILEIGVIKGITAPTLNMLVRKSGRTTALTTGEITVLETTVTVNYGWDLMATFEDQILTNPMSQGGDSGSLLVAGNAPLAVGLLFAGSDQVTIHNPIQAVFTYLKVQVDKP
jgi:hypothetical protein